MTAIGSDDILTSSTGLDAQFFFPKQEPLYLVKRAWDLRVEHQDSSLAAD